MFFSLALCEVFDQRRPTVETETCVAYPRRRPDQISTAIPDQNGGSTGTGEQIYTSYIRPRSSTRRFKGVCFCGTGMKLPEPGNLGRKMLARERKGTASVRARDKLWRRTGRTGAAQRIHWLIYFRTSCWQPGRARISSLPIEIWSIFMWTEIPRKLLKPHTANVWLCLGRTICLFFRGNKSNEMF